MPNLFIAPHPDDEALFGSYIIMRGGPIKVIVCTDGVQHKEKFDIDIETRRNESREGCKLLGCEVEFLGLSDATLTKKELKSALKKYDAEMIFAPLKTGGNPQHDMLSDVAHELWGDKKVWYYGTYSKENLSPTGEQGFIPSLTELKRKMEILSCYESQIKINKPHFDAVVGVPEYLTYKPNE